MSDEMLKVRVLRDHTTIPGWDHAHRWWQRGPTLYRDALGRRGHSTHAWSPFECSMQECHALLIVRDDSIIDAVTAAAPPVIREASHD